MGTNVFGDSRDERLYGRVIPAPEVGTVLGAVEGVDEDGEPFSLPTEIVVHPDGWTMLAE